MGCFEPVFALLLLFAGMLVLFLIADKWIMKGSW